LVCFFALVRRGGGIAGVHFGLEEDGMQGLVGGGGGVEGGWYVGLTTLLPSCADCLQILGVLAFWNLKGLSRPVRELLY